MRTAISHDSWQQTKNHIHKNLHIKIVFRKRMITLKVMRIVTAGKVNIDIINKGYLNRLRNTD